MQEPDKNELQELLTQPIPDPESPDFSYAQALEVVEMLAQKMQSNNTGFEQSVACHQRGLEWVEACEKYLDRTELQLKGVLSTAQGPEIQDMD